jgi:hypothetical protein
VKATVAALQDGGIQATDASPHRESAPDCWAAFFTDPQGIRLEATNYRQERRDRPSAGPNWRPDAARQAFLCRSPSARSRFASIS